MKLGGIDMNLIVALDALLRERSVTRAAKRIGLGQSATSHALARLRAHFGDPLLVKAGRELVLTERAAELVAPCAAAVAGLEHVFMPAAPFDPAKSRRVFRVAATDNLELYVLPRLASLIAGEAPRVGLRFRHLPKDWRAALARGDFEVKLGRTHADTSPDLRVEDLFDDELALVVRRGHPLAGRRPTLRQYAALSHVQVTPGETERGPVDELLARRGLERRIAITVSHFLVALFVVAASDHAVTIPLRVVDALSPALGVVVVPLPFTMARYALSQTWSERSDLDPGHLWLRGAIRRAVAG
jgi:DNA-binding transcriptional LysR family regulator